MRDFNHMEKVVCGANEPYIYIFMYLYMNFFALCFGSSLRDDGSLIQMFLFLILASESFEVSSSPVYSVNGEHVRVLPWFHFPLVGTLME